jgi:hypothetical protein
MCPEVADTVEDRRHLAEFLATQSGLEAITVDQVEGARTRQDLGITSLQVILVMVNYLAAVNNELAFRPEWVSRLDEIDGIASVMREIDSLALTTAASS